MTTELDDYIATRADVRAYLDRALSDAESHSQQEAALFETVKDKLLQSGARLVAHYYVDSEIQRLAEETGGLVSDSLEMARFGASDPAETLIVAGVSFMGETAKILSPEKRVYMPTLEATCSLDLGCPADKFHEFCDAHPDHTVVVIESLTAQGQSLIWAPDRYLGRYIQKRTGAEMLLWDSACVVHEEFRLNDLDALQSMYPDAGLLVHPESPEEMIDRADAVGSTSQLIDAAERLPNPSFIVATDRGIFYKMQQRVPSKRLIEAPTRGAGGTCQSCAHCPWMAMNRLSGINHLLDHWSQKSEIVIDPALAEAAMKPLTRMLEFKASQSA